MSASKSVYRVFRSVLFTAVLTVIGLFVCLYVAVSIPWVQNRIRLEAEKQLTEFLGGKVEIGVVEILPFNELRLNEVGIYTPEGSRCLSVAKLGAGISLWQLITSGRVEVTYAEIISLDARIVKPAADAPLNIDFIIRAFQPKDKNKPPSKFDVILRNVVIRKSRLSFDKTYLPISKDRPCFDINHLLFTNIRADIALPRLTDHGIDVDLRRLAFSEQSGLSVSSIALQANISPSEITLKDIRLRLEDTDISLSDQHLAFNGYDHIPDALQTSNFNVTLRANPLNISEFSFLFPPLEAFSNPASLTVEASGDLNSISLRNLEFEDYRTASSLSLKGRVSDFRNLTRLSADDVWLSFEGSRDFISKITDVIPDLNQDIKTMIGKAGDVAIEVAGNTDIARGEAEGKLMLATSVGMFDGEASATGLLSKTPHIEAKIMGEQLAIGEILGVAQLGEFALEATAKVTLAGMNSEGLIDMSIPDIVWNGREFQNITASLTKTGKNFRGNIVSPADVLDVNAEFEGRLDGSASQWLLAADLRHILPGQLGLKGFAPDALISGIVNAEIRGNNPDNLLGTLDLSHINVSNKKINLNLNKLALSAIEAEGERKYNITSDIIHGDIYATLLPSAAVRIVKEALHDVLPEFFPQVNAASRNISGDVRFQLVVEPADEFFSSLNAPVRPGVPVVVSGNIGGSADSLSFRLDAPYLIQGKNKLLRNSALSLSKSGGNPALVSLTTDFPVKNDRALLNLNVRALNDSIGIDAGWSALSNPDSKGSVSLLGGLHKKTPGNAISTIVNFLPGSFSLNSIGWKIEPASVIYDNNTISVDHLRISNPEQLIAIAGNASALPGDTLNVQLQNIDLSYIFDILNIDNVDFGGIATGSAHVTSLFTKSPRAFTKNLFVKQLAYNNSVLGDAALESHWDHGEKMVAINADVQDGDSASATVRGGVYVTRDSLSFDFGARHLDIRFLQPFMSGFTSKVAGHASGHVKLYGTFSDLDLFGDVFADDIAILVDQSNVIYHGSDSLSFRPGKISIPGIRLYDRFGHSAYLEGNVTHNFLKDAFFNFRVTDMQRLLVFDTDCRLNPQWYGRVFANGMVTLKGVPGLIHLSANASTAPDTEFNLVLDETEEAIEYTFLTFSDHAREAREKEEVTLSFEDRFYSSSQNNEETTHDNFLLDLALDVTPDAKMVIVMDPKAGDKITANGAGALQMHYQTASDNFSIYGKYSLLSGVYNFSLQDLILKNFRIREGSNITFNGDPLRGMLDITAAYRVNSNLKDLDAGFANDPDLKRTVVPVEALLKVTGDIHAPEIKFDMELPTVTSDVERKVRSIVSTEDMLNRQVIYLLALNRFYTPEYMGAEQGGELASVASSTLSSQIQNIIGSLTDKVMVAPSFKSEKSDLSDMEVDLALSSSFFDNRLLLNGNLGYRDKSSSQTTFVGDFDLEYLLSRDGRLRLKAYNHFNDASYYLNSALTTQGIGIVYRKEFEHPFTFLKRMFRRKEKSDSVKKE